MTPDGEPFSCATRGPADRAGRLAPSFPRSSAIDPMAFAEATIGGLIGLVALSPPAKRRLGLSGASRRADGWPAWYLWFAGCDGAYELTLAPPDEDAPAGAEFILRYYPHPDEDVFADFAEVERQARVSALFDHTGTPAIETLANIDPSLFHIAAVSLLPSRRHDCVDLVLECQDVWLETDGANPESNIRRRVPGLALAAPVIDFLVCGRTYHGRHTPDGFLLTREPGRAWQVGDAGARAIASDTSLFRLEVDGLPGLGVPETLCIGGARPQATGAIAARHDGEATPPRVAPFASDTWWLAARWKFYPIGAMCGCSAEQAVVVGHDDDEAVPRRSR